MPPTHTTLARSLHDIGLATWFGGSLMGDVGLNGAASTAQDARERNAIASTGWARWTPVNLGAIAAHIVGAAALVATDSRRIAGQRGVGTASLIKTALTGGALVATGYARWLGQKQISDRHAPVDAATEPNAATPDKVASAQRQQRIVQWTVPALTGALVVMSAVMGEQQRASQVASGVASRFLSAA